MRSIDQHHGQEVGQSEPQPYEGWWRVESPYAPGQRDYRPMDGLVSGIGMNDFFWVPKSRAGRDYIYFRHEAHARTFLKNSGVTFMKLAK